jgi:hypothetical protein
VTGVQTCALPICSCQLFQRISDSLKMMCYKACTVDVRIFNYLDDFLFVAGSAEDCEVALVTFERLCASVGVPIAAHKTARPSSRTPFLGLGLDAAFLTLYIPRDKVVKGRRKLEQFLSLSSPQVRRWQSMAGYLIHLAQVLVSGRVFIGSLYGSLAGILSLQQQRRVRISKEVRSDLAVWLSFLEGMPPERSFRVLAQGTSGGEPFYTDASTSVGFGCVWGRQWFLGRWPVLNRCNIAVLKLYPIYVALHMLGDAVQDTVVNVCTDNMALVAVLNKLYSKDKALRALLRPIARLCLRRNLWLVAAHVPGLENVGPDLLSRGKVAEFRARFPGMQGLPLCVPESLGPRQCGLMSWG